MTDEIGGYLYTTTDDTYQGNSVQLTTSSILSSNPSPNPQNQAAIQSPGVQNSVTDVITTFVVGDGSDLGKTTFYYENGNTVPNGVKLHRHSVPPTGRSNFMTQHTMNGNERDVFLTRGMGSTTSNNLGGEILDVARRTTNTTTTRRGIGNGRMGNRRAIRSSGGGY